MYLLQFLFGLMVFIQLPTSTSSTGNTKTAEEMDTALAKAFKEIIATSNEPVKAQKITKEITEKSGEVTTALQDLDTKPVELKKNEGVAGLDFSAANSKFAVTLVVSSIPQLIDGVQMNDWKLILKGSLGIAASFLYFTGPWGTVATALLPLLDVIFKLTDQTVPKTEESEEEIIDRVVSAAIERAKLQDFKMELAGVRHHYTTLSGVTSAYRSTGNEITKEQANVLYNHVFDELVIFGKLASLIESKCSLPLDASLKDEKVIRAIYDCLAFVDLYSELSTLRKLVLLDIAALMKNQYGKTADNIIEMYRKEFETDAELLRFLIDPINYPTSRLIVASFYQQRHRHETTDFLLDVLATVFPHRKGNGVMVCWNEALTGQCYQMKEGVRKADNPASNDRQENDMAGYTGNIMSLFIPLGYQVFAHHAADQRGVEKAGPFTGMSVVTTPFKRGFGALPKANEKWQYLEILKTASDAYEMVKICMGAGFDIKSVCDTVDVGEYDLKTYHGAYLFNHFASMYIPDNRKVTLYDSDSVKNGIEIGPFYGPDSIEDVGHPQKDRNPGLNELALMSWTKIKVELAPAEENARRMVKVCTQADFNGRCFRVDKGEHKDIYQLKPYKGLLTEEYATFKKEFKFVSTIIPSNVQLTTYSSPEFKGLLGGPYTGQIHLPQLDWISIGSFKIEDASNDGDKKKDEGDKKKDDGDKKEDEGDKKKDDGDKKEDDGEKKKDDGDKKKKEEDKAKSDRKETIKDDGDKKENDGDKKKYDEYEKKEDNGDKEKSERKEMIKDVSNPSSAAAIDMYLDKGRMSQEAESKEITSSTKEFFDVSTSSDDIQPIALRNTTNRSVEQKTSANQIKEETKPTNEISSSISQSANEKTALLSSTNQNAGLKMSTNQIPETGEDATITDAKSSKEFNHQIRDQKFREWIQDERPLTSTEQKKEGTATRRTSASAQVRQAPPYLFINRAKKPQLPKRRFPVYKELSGIKKEVVRELKSAEQVLNTPYDNRYIPKRDQIDGVM